jgi:glycosyltransferase involved in cell wall biosynthesis
MDPALEHTIVHQFDPAEHIAGGVHGFITDLIRLAPEGHRFRIIGVDAAGGRQLGKWSAADVAGRDVSFLPVARLSAGRERRVPHTLRLIGGLLVHRPRIASDFVHAHRGETGLFVSTAFRRVPLVQFVHTDAAEAMRHRTESFWRYLPRTHLFAESLAVRRAAAAWVYNAEAARRLGTSASSVRAGQNWYDDAVFRPRRNVRRGDELTVGWIGRFEPSKDPLRAVGVFAELARRGVPFRGWFAGSGTLEDAVGREVEAQGVSRQVSLHGTLAPSGVARLLEETDVLLVTSLWEGQPRAVLEALGAGVPVVSTAVGDVPELVREGVSGCISRSGAASELADLCVEAAELSDRDGIAATVASHRASQVIGALFAELERLWQAGRT